MSTASRIKAFVAYLFLAVGAIIILLLSRNDRYAAFHARQSIAITLMAILGFVVWAVVAYPIAFIPLLGPVLSSAGFALVIALLIGLVYAWIVGLSRSLRADATPLPVVGGFATRWLGA